MQHPHWEYSGSDGPEHWGELSREFAPCKDGRAQSPIDFTTAEVKTLRPSSLIISLATPASSTTVTPSRSTTAHPAASRLTATSTS